VVVGVAGLGVGVAVGVAAGVGVVAPGSGPRVDDTPENALVFRVRVTPPKTGQVVAHALGGVPVLQELGQSPPLGCVRADGVARGGALHRRRGSGAGWFR
jgi:hypothetical protein